MRIGSVMKYCGHGHAEVRWAWLYEYRLNCCSVFVALRWSSPSGVCSLALEIDDLGDCRAECLSMFFVLPSWASKA